jgi:hypothetical protein
MFHAALVAESIFKKYGTECVITAGTDGKHSTTRGWQLTCGRSWSPAVS